MTIDEFMQKSTFPPRIRTRVYNLLINEGFTTIEQVLEYERRWVVLQTRRGAGKKTLAELRRALAVFGYSL